MQTKQRCVSILIVFVIFMLAQGCSHHVPLKQGIPATLYKADVSHQGVMGDMAPVFLAHGTDKEWNRIGTPNAIMGKDGEAKVFVDSQTPTYYVREIPFSTERDDYTNLVYRVHFSKIPHSLVPFSLTAGENVGLMVVITLNSQRQPVLVTTVHTCGCYLSIIPTSYLPKDALPGEWVDEPKKVYGEVHTPMLDFTPDKGHKILVELRPEIHRVMDVRVVDASGVGAMAGRAVSAPLVPATALERLGTGDMEPVSFFYENGLMEGFVKGSSKPWESLFMSWAALDFFVGADKAYSPMADTANPFYTSLKPWNRQKSNMWHFDRFLIFWGYNL